MHNPETPPSRELLLGALFDEIADESTARFSEPGTTPPLPSIACIVTTTPQPCPPSDCCVACRPLRATPANPYGPLSSSSSDVHLRRSLRAPLHKDRSPARDWPESAPAAAPSCD